MNLNNKVEELARTTPFSKADIASSMLSRAEKGLPFDLQFFADGGGDGGQGGEGDNPSGDKGGDETPPEKFELTQKELDKKIESEADRKLNSALQKKQQEWDSQLQEKINEALKEKERLSKLSEKERKEEEMTQKEKELARREAEIERKLLRSEAVDDLQAKGLPSDFADILLGKDAESTLENINKFKKSFDEAVNEAVKAKLRQDPPPAGGGGMGSSKGTSVKDIAAESRLIK